MFANNLVWYKLSYVKLPEGIPIYIYIYSHVFPIKPYTVKPLKIAMLSYQRVPQMEVFDVQPSKDWIAQAHSILRRAIAKAVASETKAAGKRT